MKNEDAIMRLEALYALSSENSLENIGEALRMAISALRSAEKCDHNATDMRPGFISGEPPFRIDREAWKPCYACKAAGTAKKHRERQEKQ